MRSVRYSQHIQIFAKLGHFENLKDYLAVSYSNKYKTAQKARAVKPPTARTEGHPYLAECSGVVRQAHPSVNYALVSTFRFSGGVSYRFFRR